MAAQKSPLYWQNLLERLDLEIKDPLTVIKFSAEILSEERGEDRKTVHTMNLIMVQVEKILTILKKSKRQAPE